MGTVLIADDNPADIELLQLAFAESGIHADFRTAADGRGALELIELIRPDVMLLDVKMPRIGGLQVLEAVRERSDLDDVPVVIMSSSKAEPDIARAEALGALRYWQKGSQFSDILAFVRTLAQLVPALRADHHPRPPRSPAVHAS
jgi:CheY-like chemotaxis protein